MIRTRKTQAEYWNHNTAYHPWLASLAARHRGDVLDVGCGDGLLTQRLAPVSRSVLAIDPDGTAVRRARDRVGTARNVAVDQAAFDDCAAGSARFDLITFVASLHHMELRDALLKARRLLRPSGEIAVVGGMPTGGAHRFGATPRDARCRCPGRRAAREPRRHPAGR